MRKKNPYSRHREKGEAMMGSEREAALLGRIERLEKDRDDERV